MRIALAVLSLTLAGCASLPANNQVSCARSALQATRPPAIASTAAVAPTSTLQLSLPSVETPPATASPPTSEPSAAPATITPATAPSATVTPASVSQALIFAVIGDYGMGDANESAVARLVQSWRPAFVVTTGDDYYGPAGGSGSARYDNSTGKDYCAFLAGITTTGSYCPQPGPAATNRFFPALGNHDYSDAGVADGLPATYLNYFNLPGAGLANSSDNERYYDFVQGPVHFFVLNSNSVEPDGATATSAQAAWLHTQLAASQSPWNIVVDHHPPYSSDAVHGSMPGLQWPYAVWGAQIMLSGHAHAYERIEPGDGTVYFVNGLGGAARYLFGPPVPGSQVRYNRNWGAQRVTATGQTLTLEFITIDGVVQDVYRATNPRHRTAAN
jgi:tartrate-resistant acid phosphatase type 5